MSRLLFISPRCLIMINTDLAVLLQISSPSFKQTNSNKQNRVFTLKKHTDIYPIKKKTSNKIPPTISKKNKKNTGSVFSIQFFDPTNPTREKNLLPMPKVCYRCWPMVPQHHQASKEPLQLATAWSWTFQTHMWETCFFGGVSKCEETYIYN